MTAPLFRERLTVPLRWWLLALGFAVSVLAALGYYLGWLFGIGGALVTMLVAAAIFFSAAITIVVEPELIRIGRSEIEPGYLGASRALTTDETTRRGGPDADARAHLVLRPYVSTAVEFALTDAADPVPYWLISTRRPAELAQALEQARAGADIG